MKKKIVIFAGTLNIGGVEKSLLSLLQSIDFNRYDIDLILKSNSGILQKYIPNEVNIKESPKFYKWIFLPKNNLIKALLTAISFNLNFLRCLYYLIKGLIINNMAQARQELMQSCMNTIPRFDGTYDVAIDYTGEFKSLILNKVCSSKYLSWIHGDYKVYKRDKNIDLQDYSKVDGVVTVSETCKNIFISEFPQFEYKCFTMQNITSKRQIIEMSKEHINFDEDFKGIKVLDISRLDPNKGIEIAIQACKVLLDFGYNIKWYILGEGPERFNLEKLIEQNNLEENFILLGLKDNPYPYIKKVDLVVHCSLFEGKSVAIDEAMLLAKPIIVTNYLTAKDQIQDRITGLICDISVEGVVNAVKELIDNYTLRNKLVNNLLEYISLLKNL